MTGRTAPVAPSGDRSSLRLISARSDAARRAPGAMLMLLAFVALAVVSFLGMVWSRTLLDEGAFRLADLRSRIEQETVQNRLLRLEVARLENPDRVASLAEPLGLFYPDEVVHVHVADVVPEIPGFDPPE